MLGSLLVLFHGFDGSEIELSYGPLAIRAAGLSPVLLKVAGLAVVSGTGVVY